MKRLRTHIDERILNKIRYMLTCVQVYSDNSYQTKEDSMVNKAIMSGNIDDVSEPKLTTPNGIFLSFMKASSDKNEKFYKFVRFWKESHKIYEFFKNILRIREERIRFLHIIWDLKVKEATK